MRHLLFIFLTEGVQSDFWCETWDFHSDDSMLQYQYFIGPYCLNIQGAVGEKAQTWAVCIRGGSHCKPVGSGEGFRDTSSRWGVGLDTRVATTGTKRPSAESNSCQEGEAWLMTLLRANQWWAKEQSGALDGNATSREGWVKSPVLTNRDKLGRWPLY